MAQLSPEVKIRFDFLKDKLSNYGRKIKSIVEQGRAIATDPTQLFLFKGMHKELKPYFDNYNSTWESIMELVSDKGGSSVFPDKNDKTNQIAIERYYYEASAIYEHHMNPTPQLQASTSSAPPSGAQSLNLNDSRTVRARLPQINLPQFSGNPAEWPLFRDTYISLIHEETTLSDMEKFLFLVSCLNGAPRSLISNISLNENNYSQAWKLLLEHYNNKRKLAITYLNNIINFKSSSFKPTPSSLKSIITSVVEQIQSFSHLGIPNQEDFIKSYLVLRCLDPITRRNFEKKFSETEFPSYKELVNFIKNEWKAMDLYSTDASTDASSSLSPQSKSWSKNRPRHSFFTNHPKPSINRHKQLPKNPHFQKSTQQCPVCRNHHSLYHCERFRTASAADKITLLKNWSGCTNCLSPNHCLQKCISLRRCQICNENHHTWLHLRAPQNDNVHPESQGKNDGCALGGISCDGEVLLGTAILQAKDSEGGYANIRAVTDSGSQVSFITTECAKRLGINIEPCDQSISGIGQIKLNCPLGKINCVLRSSLPSFSSKELSVKLTVVPKITGNLPHSTLPISTRNQFKGFALADPDYWQPGPVEFLLGGDLFFDILTGQPIIVDQELPRLVPTIFGFIIAGPLASISKKTTKESINFLVQSDDLKDVVKVVTEEEDHCKKALHENGGHMDSEASTVEEALSLQGQPIPLLDVTFVSQWHFIKSEENPADCSSRGILLSELPKDRLWWAGSSWMSRSKKQWPSHNPQFQNLPETKRNFISDPTSESSTATNFIDWSEGFSSYSKLLSSNRNLLWQHRLRRAKIKGTLHVFSWPIIGKDRAKQTLYLAPRESSRWAACRGTHRSSGLLSIR